MSAVRLAEVKPKKTIVIKFRNWQSSIFLLDLCSCQFQATKCLRPKLAFIALTLWKRRRKSQPNKEF